MKQVGNRGYPQVSTFARNEDDQAVHSYEDFQNGKGRKAGRPVQADRNLVTPSLTRQPSWCSRNRLLCAGNCREIGRVPGKGHRGEREKESQGNHPNPASMRSPIDGRRPKGQWRNGRKRGRAHHFLSRKKESGAANFLKSPKKEGEGQSRSGSNVGGMGTSQRKTQRVYTPHTTPSSRGLFNRKRGGVEEEGNGI